MMDDALKRIVGQFSGKRVCVLGDVILDEYVWGHVNRISPEAPVPVLEIRERTYRPGGAANVAANVAALGGAASLVGLVGDDYHAQALRQVLKEQGIGCDELMVDPGRPTTAKTRIMAHNQQIARLDNEQSNDAGAEMEEGMKALIDAAVETSDACMISDYNKGAVTNALAQHLIARAAKLGKPVVVDPKGDDYTRYRGADVIKPNLLEAEHALKKSIQSDHDLSDVCRRILELVNGRAILLTRGEKGMTLFEAPHSIMNIPAITRNVYDVTGAGDTVVSVMALALASGAKLSDAALLANTAAGIVVGKVGAATVSIEELLQV